MNGKIYRDDSSSENNFNTKSCSFSPNEKNSIVKIKKSDLWSASSNNSSKSESPEYSPKSVKKKKISRGSRDMISFKMYVDEDENFQEDEKLPERIEGNYFYDYNILLIDEILMKKFQQDKNRNLKILKQKLKEENDKINGRQNLLERKVSRKKIKEIEDQIYKYEQNLDKNEYITKSRPLLESYKKIGFISTVISFTSSNNHENEILSPENEEKQKHRHKIIFEYLEIARKYIPIDLIRNIPDKNSCPNCGVNRNDSELIEDETGAIICSNCGLEKINIVKTQFYSDGCRLNNSKNNYEDRANFEKVLMRFQGKQQNKPDRALYEKLDEYFKSRGLPTSKEYNEMPLLPDGTKKGTSREMMFEALSRIGCSGYYDDINLICSVFFGWTLPNISHLEEKIMEDYDIFQDVYEQLDLEGRKSSLNSQWKLYILLKRRGYPCKSKNFKIPTTPSILEYHKIKTKEVYRILGWECPF